jgi:hypothetical protein
VVIKNQKKKKNNNNIPATPVGPGGPGGPKQFAINQIDNLLIVLNNRRGPVQL